VSERSARPAKRTREPTDPRTPGEGRGESPTDRTASVGGLGIANVMSISVVQRSAEIGIRRAVGHSRSTIGTQFLLESSTFVGLLGGSLGAAIGVGVVYLVSFFEHWVVEIGYAQIPLWMGLALLVSVLAGLYPSIKAARLQPLETLRLG